MGILDIFSSVVTGVGAVADLYESYTGAKYRNEMFEQGSAESARVAENQALLKQLAMKNLQTAEAFSDDESYRRAAGIYRALLAGAEPQELEPFRNQFDEIEYETQAQLRDIDAQAQAARRTIASNVPTGGMKIRMLADVAMKAQDLKAAATAGARDKVRTLNVELKDKYMSEALNFGKEQPQNVMSGYEKSAGILSGYPTAYPSAESRLYTSQNVVTKAGESLGTLGESIGKLSTMGKETPTAGVEYKATPSYEKFIPGADKYENLEKFGLR